VKVRVKLYSFFSFLSGTPDGIVEIEAAGGLSVADILGRCGVKKDYIALIRLNGINKYSYDEEKLSDGDYVEIFPVFGGG